jgi:hypothetical protein
MGTCNLVKCLNLVAFVTYYGVDIKSISIYKNMSVNYVINEVKFLNLVDLTNNYAVELNSLS